MTKFHRRYFLKTATSASVGLAGISQTSSLAVGTLKLNDGAGSEGNPNPISDVDELQAIAKSLNQHYELVDDIDASPTKAWNDGAGFKPLGNQETPFNGTFDGANYRISELFIDLPQLGSKVDIDALELQDIGADQTTGLEVFSTLKSAKERIFVKEITVRYPTVSDHEAIQTPIDLEIAPDGGVLISETLSAEFDESRKDETEIIEATAYRVLISGEEVGLFGRVGSSGRIENVEVVRAEITGNQHVGVLVGIGKGTINGVSVTGIVEGDQAVGGLGGTNSGGRVERSKAQTEINKRPNSNQGNIFGGLLGQNIFGGLTSESVSVSAVEGESSIGGLVGTNGLEEARVRKSYAMGPAIGTENVGGLVGWTVGGAIDETFATGLVTGEEAIGGLLGKAESSTVERSYWDIDATGVESSAGLSPEFGLQTKQMTGEDARENMVGFDFENTWAITDGYPVLVWENGQPIEPPPERLQPALVETKLGNDEVDGLAPFIDSASVTYLDDYSRMEGLISDLEAAIADEALDASIGNEALRRLILGEDVIGLWLRGVSQTEYPDPANPDIALAEDTAVALIEFAIVMHAAAWVAKKVAAKIGLSPAGELLLAKVIELVGTAVIKLEGMLLPTEGPGIQPEADDQAEEIASDLLDGHFESASDVNDAIQRAADRLGVGFGQGLQANFEDPPPFLEEIARLGLSEELDMLETGFNPAVITADGLEGTLADARQGVEDHRGLMDGRFREANRVMELWEEEFQTIRFTEAMYDLHISLGEEEDPTEAFLNFLRLQVALILDAIGLISAIFGELVAGGSAMILTSRDRHRAVESAINGGEASE